MTTALDLITDAGVDVGAFDPLEPLTTDEATHGLRKLNQMLDLWGTESLFVYQVRQENFPTTVGVASYTIGSGATWNTDRPLKIESAFLRDVDIDYPLHILEREDFDGIVLKTTRFRPVYLYYDPAFPTGTVTLYGVPDKAYTIFLNRYSRLQSFVSLMDVVSLPPGYEATIVANLGLVLAVAYHRNPTPMQLQAASTTRASIKSINSRVPILDTSHAAVQRGRRFASKAAFLGGF